MVLAGGTGAAVVIFQQNSFVSSFGYSLHPFCSIFQAELFAILQALLWVLQSPTASFCSLFSDSQSALQSLQNRNSTNYLIFSIQRLYVLLLCHHKFVHFCWIPSHSGIAGNELADLYAKFSALSFLPPVFSRIPLSYFKHSFRQASLFSWTSSWLSLSPHSLTKAYFPTLVFPHYALPSSSYKLTQFLTGHGPFQSYFFRFKLSSDALCDCGSGASQDVSHVLFSCPKFSIQRQPLLVAVLHHPLPWPPPLSSFFLSPSLTSSFLSFINSIKL